MRETLEALLARVEKATGETTGSSRKLDHDIELLVGGSSLEKRGALTLQTTARNYSASVDAATELVAKALPGCNWRVQDKDGAGRASAIVRREHPTKHFDVWEDAQGATPALALIATLLKALIATDAAAPIKPSEKEG